MSFLPIQPAAFVFRSINYEYKTGQLSITQRQGIINCIPKGDKFMKNWRPISLLNTVYKLASSCITERIFQWDNENTPLVSID
jgi:hypothetical protein